MQIQQVYHHHLLWGGLLIGLSDPEEPEQVPS